MKFAASVAMVDPSYYVPLARAAEESGFDVVTISDSIGYPRDSDSTYPYTPDGGREFLENKPFIEPIVAATAMATATETIEFCTFVLKLPVRHPVLFAKELTSLAVLSNNRFRLGAGTSPWPDDYALVGLPWEHRGRRFVECVEVIRGLATGEYFEYHGEFYDFDAVKLNPAPSQPIPILIGGISDALVDRAARIGDGWLPTGISPERFGECIATLQRLREEYGRADLPFDIYSGARNLDDVHALEAIGVTHVAGGFGTFNPYSLEPDTESLEDKIANLRRYGDEVIAPYRS